MSKADRDFGQRYCIDCGCVVTIHNGPWDKKRGRWNGRRCNQCLHKRKVWLANVANEDKPWRKQLGGNKIIKCPVCGYEKSMQRNQEYSYIFCGVDGCNARLDNPDANISFLSNEPCI